MYLLLLNMAKKVGRKLYAQKLLIWKQVFSAKGNWLVFYQSVYILGDDDDINENFKELAALKIVTQAIVKNDVLNYVYEEYEVNNTVISVMNSMVCFIWGLPMRGYSEIVEVPQCVFSYKPWKFGSI